MNLDFNCSVNTFKKLSVDEWYAISKLREEVFVVEQDCVYLDADGKDPFCKHVSIKKRNKLVAYCRIVPAGMSYAEASIGRVVVHTNYRGANLGNDLMSYAIQQCRSFYPGAIRISAQEHLTKFYSNHGFVTVGESYLEDGIPHIEMLLI